MGKGGDVISAVGGGDVVAAVGGGFVKGRGLVEHYIILKVLFTLGVIHYNIMLCTLARARKWDLVESLWTEMNAKGVAPVNSTYGTLIDAYSKGGLKEEALAWLQTMQSQGMEPDEVTMGIVVLLYKRAGEFQKAQEFFRRWIRGAPFRLGVDDKLVSHTNVCLSSHTYATFIDTYGLFG